MSTTKNRLGLTLLETVVVIFLAIMAILVILTFLLPPYHSSHRQPARRIQCQTKIKDIVLACNLYEGKYKRLPPSCHVKEYTTADGATAYHKDGYSFLVDLLPEMEQEALYRRMDVTAQLDAENDVPEGDKINAPDEVLAKSLPMYRCPSTNTDAKTNGQAITNYKAVSGTTRRAYEVSSRTDSPAEGLDIYGINISNAPKEYTFTDDKTGEYTIKVMRTASDGVMYPGSRTTLGSILDGTTNTFLVVESDEPLFARWIVGQECGLYTMPEGTALSPPTDEIPYIHLTGYTRDKYGSDSTIPKDQRLTNLNRDYTKSPYPWGENGFRSARYTKEPATGTRLGPSSGHQGVVIHGFVGGSADAISVNIDPAAYFFLTTRANDDPSPSIVDAM